MFTPWSVMCLLADGRRGKVTNMVKIRVRLLSFSWDHEIKILNEGPFTAILGLHFLQRTQMRVDIPSRTYSFGFALSCTRSFFQGESNWGGGNDDNELYLQHLCVEVADLAMVVEAHPTDLNLKVMMAKFPAPFSSSLGTTN